jgi:hypothetical protein
MKKIKESKLREIVREETRKIIEANDLRDAKLSDLEIKFVCWLYNLPENSGGPIADETNYWYIATDHLFNILDEYIKKPSSYEKADLIEKGKKIAKSALDKMKRVL